MFEVSVEEVASGTPRGATKGSTFRVSSTFGVGAQKSESGSSRDVVKEFKF